MKPVNLEDCKDGCISYCHPSRIADLPSVPGGMVFAPHDAPDVPGVQVVRVDDPKASMIRWLVANGFDALGGTRIHPTAIIGGPAFDFRGPDRFPSLGGVVLGDDVHIGAYTCIDGGNMGDTVIGDGTRIDNLVHIGHNAKIGKRCTIVAGAVIGGWVEIGDDTFVGMGALIRNRVKVGSGCTIGMGSVVVKDVADGVTIKGNPAR
jgi:UDP-3-O-[3-hydroxymyristoyl] glucosamine N-acyltransferase